MGWITPLPYPWCTPDDLLRTMPRSDALASVLAAVARYLKALTPQG